METIDILTGLRLSCFFPAMQIIGNERPREDAGLRDGVIIKTCAKVVRQNESRSDVKVALHNFYDVMQKREYKKNLLYTL